MFGAVAPLPGYTLLPIIWLFISTIQTQASFLTLPVAVIPREVILRHYVDIFKPAAFGEVSGRSIFVLALRNSLVVSVGETGGHSCLGYPQPMSSRGSTCRASAACY